MKIITKNEFLENKKFYLDEIRKGKIYIYPTDTIYGIGCDALKEFAVKKIRKIKQRDTKPFSIIVPNKNWIYENCIVYKNHKNYIDKLPGKYTFILKLKYENKTVGIRMPNNWFSKFLFEHNLTFITTSVNLTGEKHITKLEDLSEEIKNQVDYFIDDGEINNHPSTIIDLRKEKEKIIRK